MSNLFCCCGKLGTAADSLSFVPLTVFRQVCGRRGWGGRQDMSSDFLYYQQISIAICSYSIRQLRRDGDVSVCSVFLSLGDMSNGRWIVRVIHVEALPST